MVNVPMTSLPGSASQGLNRPRLLAPLGTERRGDGAGSDGHCSIVPVRRLIAWLAGLAGGVAAYRRFRRAPLPVPDGRPDDRAGELKERLAAARAAADDRDVFEAGETPVDAAPDPVPEPPGLQQPPGTGSGDLAERRRCVHERARAAIDEMQREPDGA